MEGIQGTQVTMAARSGGREIGCYVRRPDEDGVVVYHWVPASEGQEEDLPERS